MTRSDDTTISQKKRLDTIKQTFGDTEGVLVLINDFGEGGEEGASITSSLKDTNPQLAEKILTELEKTGQKNLGINHKNMTYDINKDYNYLLSNLSKAKAYIIEYGRLDNKNDIDKIMNHRYDLAEAVVKAVSEYYNIPYQEQDKELKAYIVKKGDSLYSIAQAYNTTVGTLLAINNLNNNIIHVGQVIRIPSYKGETSKEEGIIIYTVQENDTINSIAEHFKIDPNKLISYNELFNVNIQPGMQLTIPKEPSPSETTSNILYTVKKGDTIYNIAKRFNTTVKELMEQNNLEDMLIKTGQKLLIPKTENYTTYYVKTNDTLEKIAKNFNTTIDILKKLNNLTSNEINVGQLLLIP